MTWSASAENPVILRHQSRYGRLSLGQEPRQESTRGRAPWPQGAAHDQRFPFLLTHRKLAGLATERQRRPDPVASLSSASVTSPGGSLGAERGSMGGLERSERSVVPWGQSKAE